MNAEQRQMALLHPIDHFLATLGGIACVAITLVIWKNVSAYQGMWPLPALYFIEVAGLSAVGAFLFLRGGSAARTFLWGTVGILTAFCILGMFSVGILYFPIALLFATACIISDVRDRSSFGEHLAVCLLAGLAQTALMLAVIRWLV